MPRMRETTGRMRPRSLNAAALGLGLVASLLLGEGALRLFHPQRTWNRLLDRIPPMFLADPSLPYALKPGFTGRLWHHEYDTRIEINAEGRRDRPPHPAPRALVVGDSFVFGFGVEEQDAFPALLQKSFRATGPFSSILNAGFPGFDPGAYYVFLEDRGMALGPSLVLIGFFSGNDIDPHRSGDHRWADLDARGLPRRIVTERHVVRDGRQVRKRLRFRYRVPWIRNSHLFQLFVTAGKRSRRVDPRHEMIYARHYDAETRARVSDLQSLFVGMRDLTRAQGVPLAVLMLPSIEQVHPERLRDPERFDLDKPQRLFSAFFRENGIPHLDLLPGFETGAADRALYFPFDEHWNEAGHALAARLIADFLREGELKIEVARPEGARAIPPGVRPSPSDASTRRDPPSRGSPAPTRRTSGGRPRAS